MKMLKEERELRDWPNEYLDLSPEKRKLLLKDITAFRRAVMEAERGYAAERAYAEYLRMFGDSKQNILRAGQIAAAIRKGGGK